VPAQRTLSNALETRARGFTLLELTIALAIVAVLATLAIPACRSYWLRAHRAEARAVLLSLAAAQEKYYLTCNAYAADLDGDRETSCDPAQLRFPARSEHGLYALVMSAADTEAWSATATAAPDAGQALDYTCQVFGLDSTGSRTAVAADGTATDVQCWSR
jgi:type IV pilus assembly protein PilE